MKRFRFRSTRTHLPASLAVAGLLWLPAALLAQTTGNASAPHTHSQAAGQTVATPTQDAELQKQLAELRAQVVRLQAALDQLQQMPQTPTAGTPASAAQPPVPGMTGTSGGTQMGEMSRMGGRGMGSGQMGGMSSGGMSMMDMDMHKGEMGMPPEGMKMPDNMMMGEMEMGGMPMGGNATAGTSASSGMAGMTTGSGSTGDRASGMPRSMSSLPGVPGASHVYHIGSTGFFLDQPQLNLTTTQQTALNRIKERALLERADAERRIEQAEQELWALTGADQPDAAKVQAKLQEIEQLRTNQRIGFIRAVGEATKQLTPEQQNALLGTTPPTK